MSRIDDALDAFDDEYAGWFEDDLRITNYEAVDTATGPEEFDSPDEKQKTADSPISTTGQIDLIASVGEQSPWGRDVDADYEAFLDEVTISDGEVDGLPYPSDIEHVPTGQKYRVVDIHDEGRGHLRCLVTNIPDE